MFFLPVCMLLKSEQSATQTPVKVMGVLIQGWINYCSIYFSRNADCSHYWWHMYVFYWVKWSVMASVWQKKARLFAILIIYLILQLNSIHNPSWLVALLTFSMVELWPVILENSWRPPRILNSNCKAESEKCSQQFLTCLQKSKNLLKEVFRIISCVELPLLLNAGEESSHLCEFANAHGHARAT